MIRLFIVVLFTLLTIHGAWCETSMDNKRWNFMNGPWVSNETRPPVPTWPQQFISDFYLYIKKYGEDFRSKGAIIYDWTKRVSVFLDFTFQKGRCSLLLK